MLFMKISIFAVVSISVHNSDIYAVEKFETYIYNVDSGDIFRLRDIYRLSQWSSFDFAQSQQVRQSQCIEVEQEQ